MVEKINEGNISDDKGGEEGQGELSQDDAG